MKIQLDKSILQKCLEILVMHRGKVSQIMGCVLFDAAPDGSILLIASDGVTGAQAHIEGVVQMPGRAAIPLEMLTDVVGGLPPGSIDLAVAGDVVTVRAGSFNVKIKLLDPDSFPVEIESTGDEIEIPYDALMAAISGVTYAASNNQSGGYMTGIHFVANGEIMLEACDGVKMARTRVAVQGSEAEALIPASALDKVMRTLGKIDGADIVQIVISPERLTFILDGADIRLTTFTAASADPYPNLGQIIPLSPSVNATLQSADLLAALRVALAVNRQNDITRVKVILDDRGVTIRTPQGQAGESTSTAPATVEGGAGEMFVNAEFFRQAVERLGEMVTIGFNAALKPLKLTDDTNAVHIILPMQ